MRIIGGNHRGRHLIAPQGLPARPTTDFAKVALFNILDNRYYFEDVEVLDLFAGTGNISYEFASRGCRTLTCVEGNRKCADFIRKTAAMLGFTGLSVVQADAMQFVKSAPRKWDIIFADPPFDFERTAEIPGLVMEREMLRTGGCLVLEHDKKHNFEQHRDFREHRTYGNVHFSFFEKYSVREE